MSVIGVRKSSALKFNFVQLIKTNLFLKGFLFKKLSKHSIHYFCFVFVFFAQNLKVAVPESISADLGECIPAFPSY